MRQSLAELLDGAETQPVSKEERCREVLISSNVINLISQGARAHRRKRPEISALFRIALGKALRNCRRACAWKKRPACSRAGPHRWKILPWKQAFQIGPAFIGRFAAILTAHPNNIEIMIVDSITKADMGTTPNAIIINMIVLHGITNTRMM